MNDSRPALSVIVAARDSAVALVPCLQALAPQMAGQPVECVIVGPEGADAEALAADFGAAARSIQASPGALVPELWSVGIAATEGSIVALTVADCVPEPGWIARILAAPWESIDALGGGFDVAEPARWRDRAALYLRYWSFPRSGQRSEVDDLAADNVAYRRGSLMRCEETWRDGFWEPPVHRRMRALGMRLLFDPGMWVAVRHVPSVRSFAKQRFLHGWWFARQRLATLSRASQMVRILGAPLVPLVMLARICRALAVQGRLSPSRLVPALPLMTLYLISWSVGELLGYSGLRPSGYRETTPA